MKTLLKTFGIFALSLIAIFMLMLVTGTLNLAYKSIFLPKNQNVERRVFEETKSYVHGKVQDLARYYEQYNNAKTIQDKQAIANLIKMQFADFNENNINNDVLKRFLVKIRGY